MPEERIGIVFLEYPPPFLPGNLADTVASMLSRIFPSSVRITAEILPSRRIPSEAYDEVRRVCVPEKLIDALSDKRNGYGKILGITALALLQDNRRQVMGASRMDRSAAVLSLAGLDPGTGDTRTHTLFFERTAKEAAHAVAHLYGIPHCPDEKCIMHLSGGTIETDRKQMRFCPLCRDRGAKPAG